MWFLQIDKESFILNISQVYHCEFEDKKKVFPEKIWISMNAKVYFVEAKLLYKPIQKC